MSELSFTDKKLEQLYTEGKSSKYKLQAHVIEGFFKACANLRASETVGHLWGFKSLHFERLKQGGKKSGLYSVRVDKSYRLEFRIEWEDGKEDRISKYVISELSNHYGG